MGDTTALIGLSNASVEWQRDVPYSVHFKDGYFSRQGGVEESKHVFLRGNRLQERWPASGRFTIIETGFGTGLNLLTTWDAWRKAGRPCALHYLSIEAYPLCREDLSTALLAWLELAELASDLLAQYPPGLPGTHRLLLENGQICLDLMLAPLTEALDTLATLPDLQAGAWYLDGFAPSRNPEMWTAALYHTMAQVSAKDATFATYTAAGTVRRGLVDAGFEVTKEAGFGNKRDMLTGRLLQHAAATPLTKTPWQLPAHRFVRAAQGNLTSEGQPGRIAIIGAGLAGASIAEALARRGFTVTVYEAGNVAAAGSGNSQGALYTRLSHQASSLSLFALHSYCFALRRYGVLLNDGRLSDGELCGLLQIKAATVAEDPLRQTIASLPELVRELSAAEAAAITGLPECPGGIFFPGSGWMNPAAVCNALLAHPGIHLHTRTGALSLRKTTAGWALLDSSGDTVDQVTTVVVACGIASADFIDADWLALQAIRGQTTEIPSNGALAGLATVICHDGYLPPTRRGRHCIGATFDLQDSGTDLRPEDHQRNLRQLADALPALSAALPDPQSHPALGGHASHRCASRDYLPMVGPVPATEAFCDDFAVLRRNARTRISRCGSYLPGLYLNTGHGARGLTSTPLAAELLAAQICGEAWPMPADLAQALAPARFLIRDLVRGKR